MHPRGIHKLPTYLVIGAGTGEDGAREDTGGSAVLETDENRNE